MDVRDRLRLFVCINGYVEDPLALRDGDPFLASAVHGSSGVAELAAFLRREFSVPVDENDFAAQQLASIDAIAGYIQRVCGHAFLPAEHPGEAPRNRFG